MGYFRFLCKSLCDFRLWREIIWRKKFRLKKDTCTHIIIIVKYIFYLFIIFRFVNFFLDWLKKEKNWIEQNYLYTVLTSKKVHCTPFWSFERKILILFLGSFLDSIFFFFFLHFPFLFRGIFITHLLLDKASLLSSTNFYLQRNVVNIFFL